MITKNQIDQLVDYFKIDRFTIFREYLQLIFLTSLYQEKTASKICFKGGTAIHLLLNSPRFSEDLDFSTSFDEQKIKSVVKKVSKNMSRELSGLKINLYYQGKKSLRFKFNYKPSDFKYPFNIRLDFRKNEKLGKISVSPLLTKFPLIIFPLISHFSSEELLAEKICALLTRGKARDVFDVWFLLTKGVVFREKFSIEKIKARIQSFKEKDLKQGLNQFLPENYRQFYKQLPKLTIELLEKSENLQHRC